MFFIKKSYFSNSLTSYFLPITDMLFNTIPTEHIARFLSAKYPNCLAAILSGSVIDGTANKDSDLDIVLIVSDKNKLYNETLDFQNLKLQTFIIPLQHLYERLYADYFNASCHFIGLLAKGKHLYGDEQLTNSIVAHSTEMKKLGPRPMSDDENLRIRIKISGGLHKLSNTNEKWEDLILYAGKIADELIGFKLHSENAWRGDGKHRMKFLEAHNSQFKKNIVAALQEVYVNKSYAKLIQVAEEEVKAKGGLIDFYSKTDIQLTPTKDFMVLHVRHSGNDNQHKQTLTSIHSLLSELKERLTEELNYYFYATFFTGEGLSEKDVLCVVSAKNEWLNDFFIDWLYFQKEKHQLNNVSFPFFIEPDYKFVSEELYKEVLPVFVKVNMLNFSDSEALFDQGFQMYAAMSLLKSIHKLYFHNNLHSFQQFLLFLFKNYIVYSYDINENKTSKELMRRRNTLLQQFEASYQSQHEILKEVWAEEEDLDFTNELKKFVSKLPNLENELAKFPDYAAYLFNKEQSSLKNKEIVVLKELSLRCMEILLIKASSIPYMFYIVLRLTGVAVQDIEEEIRLN